MRAFALGAFALLLLTGCVAFQYDDDVDQEHRHASNLIVTD